MSTFRTPTLQKDCKSFLVTMATMSNTPSWKHLTLTEAVAISNDKKSHQKMLSTEHSSNGQHSNTDYSYDYGQLQLNSNLYNTPSNTTRNDVSTSAYESITQSMTLQSFLNTPTASGSAKIDDDIHTPTHVLIEM